MSWLYIYRIISFVAAMVFGIIVVAKSVHTTSLTVSDFGGSLGYARAGMVVGILTAITLIFKLLRDLSSSPVMIVVEVISLPILSIVWVVVGALALIQKFNIFAPEGCIFEVVDPDLNAICTDMQPIGVFSFVAAGVLMMYSLVLLFVALVGSNRGTPIWHASVRAPKPKQLQEKPEAMYTA